MYAISHLFAFLSFLIKNFLTILDLGDECDEERWGDFDRLLICFDAASGSS
jgi:hypothetical protein